MKKQKTNYNIIKKNFYFIVDFCQNRKYKNGYINFKDISIFDRVFLSTYCTGLISQRFKITDKQSKKIDQMCNIIFNFSQKKTNNIHNMNMIKKTKIELEKFLKEKKEYCQYIQQNEIIKFNNNKDLFKINLNSTEFNIINKLKFKKMQYILYTIYILGTAKNHTSCAHLNKLDIRLFSKCLKSSKIILDKIFNLMNWKYIPVDKHYICWKSKWKLKTRNKDLTKEEQIEKKIVDLLSESVI